MSPAAWLGFGGIFDLPVLTQKLAEVEARMTAPDFWNNKETAQRDVELISDLRNKIQPFQSLAFRVADLEVLRELLAEESPENQPQALTEARALVVTSVPKLNAVRELGKNWSDFIAARSG